MALVLRLDMPAKAAVLEKQLHRAYDAILLDSPLGIRDKSTLEKKSEKTPRDSSHTIICLDQKLWIDYD